jgi:hypothetical protein
MAISFLLSITQLHTLISGSIFAPPIAIAKIIPLTTLVAGYAPWKSSKVTSNFLLKCHNTAQHWERISRHKARLLFTTAPLYTPHLILTVPHYAVPTRAPIYWAGICSLYQSWHLHLSRPHDIDDPPSWLAQSFPATAMLG